MIYNFKLYNTFLDLSFALFWLQWLDQRNFPLLPMCQSWEWLSISTKPNLLLKSRASQLTTAVAPCSPDQHRLCCSTNTEWHPGLKHFQLYWQNVQKDWDTQSTTNNTRYKIHIRWKLLIKCGEKEYFIGDRGRKKENKKILLCYNYVPLRTGH